MAKTHTNVAAALLVSAGALGVLGSTASTQAQERPKADQAAPPPRDADANTSEFTLKTQFIEATKSAKWREAVETFVRLRTAHPGVLADKRLRYLHAKALYEAKEVATSATELEALLEMQDNHIEALYLLARIRAESKEAADKEKSRDLLITSARAGQFVLRDISAEKAFDFLLKDPGFILRVMGASNEYAVQQSGQHNFFISPLIPKVEGETGDEPTVQPPTGAEERMKLLEERIDSLFKEIVKLAEERQVEELIVKFTELRQVMNEFGSSGTVEVRKKLEKWNQRLSELGEVQLSIKLQVYISEGNQHLRAMADAIRDDQYDAALDRFNQINDLCEQMRAEEREVFHRNAEALFLRGKALADRARRLKRISEFQLDVTGIVVAPPGGQEPDSAIINDRIYREGDPVVDKTTDEEIEGLRIVEVVRSTVRFRYEDTEFVRELRAQQP
jgi:hypothetical protein